MARAHESGRQPSGKMLRTVFPRAGGATCYTHTVDRQAPRGAAQNTAGWQGLSVAHAAWGYTMSQRQPATAL